MLVPNIKYRQQFTGLPRETHQPSAPAFPHATSNALLIFKLRHRFADAVLILSAYRLATSQFITINDVRYTAMSEFASFGGSDEEYATVRKHQVEVVSRHKMRQPYLQAIFQHLRAEYVRC